MASARGSEKLLAAWRSRGLTDASVEEISHALDESPASIEAVHVHGGVNATGVSVSMRYTDDDVPMCGNDILFWLRWHLKFGGFVKPPKIIINGIPYPDELLLRLDYGDVPAGPEALEMGAETTERG